MPRLPRMVSPIDPSVTPRQLPPPEHRLKHSRDPVPCRTGGLLPIASEAEEGRGGHEAQAGEQEAEVWAQAGGGVRLWALVVGWGVPWG